MVFFQLPFSIIINAIHYYFLNINPEPRQNKKGDLFQKNIRDNKSNRDNQLFNARALLGKKGQSSGQKRINLIKKFSL